MKVRRVATSHRALLTPDFEYSLNLPPELLNMTATSSYMLPPSSVAMPMPPLPPDSGMPTSSLFDESEQAIFGDFLDTLALDTNFLFNPQLPPNMPKLAEDTVEPTSKRQRSSPGPGRRDVKSPSAEDAADGNVDMSTGSPSAGSKRKSSQLDVPEWPALPASISKTYTLPGDMSHLSLETDRKRSDSSGSPGPRKELLSEAEKRQNHILSEQKRRNTIRSGFREITELVPTLTSHSDVVTGKASGAGVQGGAGTGGQSKSTILFKAVEYIQYLEKRNGRLRNEVDSLESKWRERQGPGPGPGQPGRVVVKE